jgi:hypothetical protein
MKSALISSIAIIIAIVSCDTDKSYTIKVNNNTNKGIQVTAGYPGYGMDSYPDTTLPASKPSLTYIEANNYNYLINRFKWEEEIPKLPKDTLSIYIFDADTVKAYGWVKIQSSYKVLNRYDLSVQDLERTNWIVTYP